MSESAQEMETQATSRLRDLFDRYCTFVRRLGVERGRDLEEESPMIYDYNSFVQWWTSLGPLLQREWEHDFRSGYDALIREGEQQVAAVLEQYCRE